MTSAAQPESLRRSLIRRMVGLMSIIVLAGATVTFLLARHYASEVFDQALFDSASTLAAQVRASTDRLRLDLPPSAVEMFEFDSVDRVYYDVATTDGTRIFGNFPLTIPNNVPDNGSPLFYNASILGKPVRIAAVRIRDPVSASKQVSIQVAETTNKRDSLVTKILLSTLGPQLVLILVSTLGIGYAVGSGMRGLEHIATMLGRYRPDRVDTLPKPESAPAEVRPILAALHEVVDKLGEAQANQQRFIVNASHQLRTPLAALQVQAERALREPDPVRHSEALESVLTTLKRMRHLSHQLLMLARAEAKAPDALVLKPLDLATLAREVLGDWADAALEAGVDLGYEGPPADVRIRGEAQLLHELIGNLVDNAIRYGGHGARVTVGIASNSATVALDVEDDGPGIPESERPRVVERFYRSAGAGSDGSGLGLAIAREIAVRHQGDLRIESGSAGRGTRVVVTFPAQAPDTDQGFRTTRYEPAPSSIA